MEGALALLAEAGIPPKERYCLFLTIIGHIRGHATFERIKVGTARKWIGELSLRTETDRYPALQATLEAGAFSKDPDEVFEYGLRCILHGIAAAGR